jgi:hypothetical protein
MLTKGIEKVYKFVCLKAVFLSLTSSELIKGFVQSQFMA